MKALALALALIFSVVFVPGSLPAAQERFVFAVHPYKSATELEFMFAPLTAYLSSIVGKPVWLSVASDYQRHVEQIGTGKADIALMGPASYVQMVEEYGRKPLLARFEVSRVPTYYGVIAVRKDSPVKLLSDLKGKRMAFSDRQSTSGHIIPRYMLLQSGISLDDFSGYTFMGNHDNVALGVLFGDYDAGSINQEVFAKYEHRGLRILAITPPISEYLFVASEDLPPETIEMLRGGIQQLGDTPEGGTIMRAMKPSLTSLVPVEDSDYENLRAIIKELRGLGIVP